MKYITINNWQSYQQYKDRNPNWVKLSIDFISKYNTDGTPKTTYALPDMAKLTFVCLMCLRATFDKNVGKIPYENDKELSQRLGLTKIDLQSLITTNLITISNESVQNRTEPYKNGTPETETEKRVREESKRNIYPTLEEFKKYIQDKKLKINNPESLFSGYSDGGWIDTKGNPIRNWKLKLQTLSNYTRPEENAAHLCPDCDARMVFSMAADGITRNYFCRNCNEKLQNREEESCSFTS